MPKLTFLRSDIQIETEEGSDFLGLSEKSPSLPLRFGCKKGMCGVCAIEVCEGHEHLSKQCSQETQTLERKGFTKKHRLACQCAINGNLIINN